MKDCIFCKIVSGELKSWKVYEDDNTLAFFDIAQANKYHTLVIPKKHYVDIYEIPENALKEVIAATKKVTLLYREKLGIDNVQIIQSSGHHAQQDVFHIHFHIVPRHANDRLNVPWRSNSEIKADFDQMLERLK